jgi:organic hydroperoxide reductase OsmC/OhrA
MIKSKLHHYQSSLTWTGQQGRGTASYTAYSRNFQIGVTGKPILEGSSDPFFRGDASRYNPEELFLASLSSCHMLWYLHLCADQGIVVLDYKDEALAEMHEGDEQAPGRFLKVLLRPEVKIKSGGNVLLAEALHKQAHVRCFIANSCNFPVLCEASILEIAAHEDHT